MNLVNHSNFYKKVFLFGASICFLNIAIAQNKNEQNAKPKLYQIEKNRNQNVNKEHLRTAKKYAKLAFIKYIEREQIKPREYVIQLNDWVYDTNSESYYIIFEVHYEVQLNDYYDQTWHSKKINLELKCDSDGSNAYLQSKQFAKTLIFTTIDK